MGIQRVVRCKEQGGAVRGERCCDGLERFHKAQSPLGMGKMERHREVKKGKKLRNDGTATSWNLRRFFARAP